MAKVVLVCKYIISLCTYVYVCNFITHVVQTEITGEVIDLLQNKSNPITFNCQAIGVPVPTISWYFNNILINVSNSSNYIISNSVNGTIVVSSLTIINAQSSDVGTYTCHAENIIGNDRSSAVLTVNGKFIFKVLLLY